jgi:AraC family transcriptional regulator of adaptative response/methylated-DNA-[protein]-cysteine methyltransferase
MNSATVLTNQYILTNSPIAQNIMKRNSPNLNELRWQSVIERDRTLDHAFVFAVKTTGVYCRPSCPSRRPLRTNVEFYPDAEMAQKRGFRACKRCRPDRRFSANEEVVRKACHVIERGLADPEDQKLDLATIAKAVGLSPEHFQRVFRDVTGVSPKQYVSARRMTALRKSLRLEDEDVTSATYAAGFSSSSRVYERTDAELGMSPGMYRKGAPGVRIRFATAVSTLGKVLVAATDKGICAVKLGDNIHSMELELKDEFFLAEIENGDVELAKWLKEVLCRVEGKHPKTLLPLDIQATAFERQVYEALLKIPIGRTRSYAEVAKSIGKPQGHRAVARACATNQATIVIPCHRVVKSDGSLSGYRWGKERKAELLKRELIQNQR